MPATKTTQTLPLAYSTEVLKALREKSPIVALESLTIIKRNSAKMLEMESLVRDSGATPATIAVVRGQIMVGLTKEQINNIETNK